MLLHLGSLILGLLLQLLNLLLQALHCRVQQLLLLVLFLLSLRQRLLVHHYLVLVLRADLVLHLVRLLHQIHLYFALQLLVLLPQRSFLLFDLRNVVKALLQSQHQLLYLFLPLLQELLILLHCQLAV